MMKFRFAQGVGVLGVALVFSTAVTAQRGAGRPAPSPVPGADATQKIVAAARAVLSSLDDAGRAKVQFAFADDAQRRRWSNLPTGIFERRGIRMGDLTPAQRDAVTNLLKVAFSANGYRKIDEIMGGDEYLRVNGDGRGPRGGQPPAGGPPPGGGRGGRGGALNFGRDEYYLSFVGAPSTTAPWLLQFGGHHLAINLTLAGSQASMAPSLPAAQPAKYTIEGREIRPLGKENDLAFQLVNGLTDAQREQAVLKYRVADLVLGPGQDGRTIQPEGLKVSALSPAQQDTLLAIVHEWAGIVTDAFGEPRMAEIKANLAQTYFAWSGSTTAGSPSYWRIQGPTLIIEYAPQQGSADHIHGIYRDPTNDYGAKIVGK